jgi:putative flippase GtrA
MTVTSSEHIRRLGRYGKETYKKNAFLRFLIAGVVNSLFGYSVFCLTFWLSGLPIYALTIATILGTFFNFFTIGNLVFRHAKPHLLLRFVATYTLVFLCNAAALLSFERCGVMPVFAQAVILPFVVVFSYILNKNFVFGEIESSVKT